MARGLVGTATGAGGVGRGGRRLGGEEKPGKGEAERSLIGNPSVPQLRPP
jgi:hypothetical protein